MGRRNLKRVHRKASDKVGQQKKAGSAAPRFHPLMDLQRSVGSSAVQRLIDSPYIQTKLQVSEPEDESEKEADKTAQSVMRSEAGAAPAQAGHTAGPGVANQLAGGGGPASPLPNTVRAFMEPRLGADLSDVRVHTGSEAARLNDQLQAQAFTHGQDVYFGAGKSPGIDTLTAHELAHVVQQADGHLISRTPDEDKKKADALKKELQALIDGAVWKEIRKRVYPKESAAGVKRAKERKAGKQTDLTGLGKISTLEHFATAIKDLQKDWDKGKKDPKDRVKAIGDAVNAELKSAGVPEFLIVAPATTEWKGFFTRRFWKFSINEKLVNQATLSNDDAAELANTALHEARHAEQEFLAARYSAGPPNNKTAPEISAEQHIPEDPIAKAAVAAKFDNKTDATVADLGKKMYKAGVTDAVANQNISDDDYTKEMKTARDEAIKSLAELNKSVNSATLADAKTKATTLKAAIAEVEKRYTDYRNIPYEADAHEVGDAAEQAFRGWPP